jgi:hypothetical protein
MLKILLNAFGIPPREIEQNDIFHDQLVVIAEDNLRISLDNLLDIGVKDILVLKRGIKNNPTREKHCVTQGYSRASDVRRNNCQVAILTGLSALALVQKHVFGRLDIALIPLNSALIGLALGLIRYSKRGYLKTQGWTYIETSKGKTAFLVIKVNYSSSDNRRQYGPTCTSPLEILRQISDLNCVGLRWIENIEQGTHNGDIDILVSRNDLATMKERFDQKVSTYPLDVYTADGSAGHGFKNAPYFRPDFANRILESATIRDSGIRSMTSELRFLSFCYHLLFHNKSKLVTPGETHINPSTFKSPHYFNEMVRLGNECNYPVPTTFDQLQSILENNHALPSLDLIGFYSIKNSFLKERFFSKNGAKPGLATFFVRDYGRGLETIDDIRTALLEHFIVLREGKVTEEINAAVTKQVRGGNWTDPKAPNGIANPVYWFICWDKNPAPPCRRTKRKHPLVDNEHLRLKDIIRKDSKIINSEIPLRIVHSSDNSGEAIEHIHFLGLSNDPVVLEKILLTKKPN